MHTTSVTTLFVGSMMSKVTMELPVMPCHTTYIRNNMGQKCEGNCDLWVLNEIIKKVYPENLKKIVGAVCELPSK